MFFSPQQRTICFKAFIKAHDHGSIKKAWLRNYYNNRWVIFFSALGKKLRNLQWSIICPGKNYNSYKINQSRKHWKIYRIYTIDGTNGNAALICKRFYAFHLFRELRIHNSKSTNTYEHSKMLIMTLPLIDVVMSFWYILEFLYQKIKNVYHQFIDSWSYIKIQTSHCLNIFLLFLN